MESSGEVEVLQATPPPQPRPTSTPSSSTPSSTLSSPHPMSSPHLSTLSRPMTASLRGLTTSLPRATSPVGGSPQPSASPSPHLSASSSPHLLSPSTHTPGEGPVVSRPSSSPSPSDIDTGDQGLNVSFANSFAILSELLFEGKLQPKQAERYKIKLSKLQQGIIKAHQIDDRLEQYSKKLKEEMDQQKDKLSKTGVASFEDNIVIANFKKDLIKAQTEASVCHEREELEKLEVFQVENRRKLLAEEVDLMRKKKEEELEPRIQSLKLTTEDMKGEIQHQKALIERMTHEVADANIKSQTNDEAKKSLEQEVNELKVKFAKMKGDPEKHRKQAEVVMTAAKNLEDELERLNNTLVACDRELSIQNKKKKDVVDESVELAIQLDKHRNNVEQRERQGDQILKELELCKEDAANYYAARAELDIDTKAKEFRTRRKEEQLIMRQREMNVALKQLRKAQFQLDFVQKSIPELQNLLVEMRRDVENNKQRARKQKELLLDLRMDVDIIMSTFLNQEDLEKETAEQLQKLHEEIKVLESELSRWTTQEGSLLREVATLTVEREARSHDAGKALAYLRDAKEDLKMKDLVIYDLTKQQQDSENRLHHYEKIYEHVKNERNKYMNLIQSIRLTDAELKEKIKILQNEIDILRTETLTKNKALMKVRAEFQALCNERDQYRNEINKTTYLQKKKQEIIDQQASETHKLNSIISATENEMRVLKKTNDELCILYEKSNIQESIIRNGEIELRRKEEELRILRLHELEALRETNVARKFLPDIPKLQKQIEDLQEELEEDRASSAKLAAQLESPDCLERWRKLEGKDPTYEELFGKIEKLGKRLDAKEEKLLQRNLELQEMAAQVEKLNKQINASRNHNLDLAAKVNEFKSKIKNTNRKMMSTVSELYKATAIQLKMEIDDTQQKLELGERRLGRGEAPTDEAEEEWYKMFVRRAVQQYERENTAAAPRITDDGRYTTATRRHDHYIHPFFIPSPVFS